MNPPVYMPVASSRVLFLLLPLIVFASPPSNPWHGSWKGFNLNETGHISEEQDEVVHLSLLRNGSFNLDKGAVSGSFFVAASSTIDPSTGLLSVSLDFVAESELVPFRSPCSVEYGNDVLVMACAFMPEGVATIRPTEYRRRPPDVFAFVFTRVSPEDESDAEAVKHAQNRGRGGDNAADPRWLLHVDEQSVVVDPSHSMAPGSERVGVDNPPCPTKVTVLPNGGDGNTARSVLFWWCRATSILEMRRMLENVACVTATSGARLSSVPLRVFDVGAGRGREMTRPGDMYDGAVVMVVCGAEAFIWPGVARGHYFLTPVTRGDARGGGTAA